MYNQSTIQSAPSLSVELLSLLRKLTSGLAAAQAVYQRVQQRRQLSMLNDHLLKDIGITRAQAELEAGKPFWRS